MKPKVQQSFRDLYQVSPQHGAVPLVFATAAAAAGTLLAVVPPVAVKEGGREARSGDPRVFICDALNLQKISTFSRVY